MADAEQKNEKAKPDAKPDDGAAPPPAKQPTALRPVLYKFKVSPVRGNVKQSALQMPFSILLDNMIAVLWSMYNSETQIRCGVNQIQWALEFMRCLKVDYKYPEGIGNIVKTLETNMIELYSKISEVQNKEKELESSIDLKGSKTDLKTDPKTDSKTDPKTDKKTDPKTDPKTDKKTDSETDLKTDTKTDPKTDSKKVDEHAIFYNEKDIMKKLEKFEIRMDKVTGKPRSIKELNQLGKRKPKDEDSKNDKSSPQTYVIGALKKILKKATEVDTITDVEELIKELNDQNTTPAGNQDKNKNIGKKPSNKV